MLNALVSAIDKRLRVRDGIFEYSDCPRCIFRAQFSENVSDIALSDGTCLAAGSPLINLHLWNEHIPPFPPQGPTLGWARQICRDLETSLEELATFLADRPALEPVVAIGANVMFGSTQQGRALAHLTARYGFIRGIDPAGASPSIAQRMHLLGEHILIFMLVIAYNPTAFRTDRFRRDRLLIYLHRSELMRRFAKSNVCARAR
jgi:hypothetical protein